LIALAATTNEKAEVIAQTPFTEAESFLFKGSEWHADGIRSSLITVGNAGAEPTNASVVLFYNGGAGRYEFRQLLKPGEQAWLNVADVIKNQVADFKGRTIPPDVTKGSYELRDLDHESAGKLFEGKITVDKTYGHAAYGCAYYCCYEDPYINPSGFEGFVGTGNQDRVWANCREDGFDYDITGLANTWTTTDSGVSGFSGSIGWVDIVGVGSSTITAYTSQASPYRTPYCKPTTRHGSGGANGKGNVVLVASNCGSNAVTGFANVLVGGWGKPNLTCILSDQYNISNSISAVCTTNSQGTSAFRYTSQPNCTETIWPGATRVSDCVNFKDAGFPIESSEVCF
jgi:hypothetical protein